MRFFYWTLLLAGLPCIGFGQDKALLQSTFNVRARAATTAPVIDGKLEDACWQSDDVARDFWLKWPVAGERANTQTEVRVSYDEKYLYIGAMCYDSTPNYVVQSLKRDAEYWTSDGLAVVLDPANRAQNGYFFGLTAAGVQNEGLLDPTQEDVDFNWDNVWVGEIQHLASGWSLEMAIPFRILRYKAGQAAWGINFIRSDRTLGQWSTWVNIPLQFDGTNLGWTGAVTFEQAPEKAKGNSALIPYVTSGFTKDIEGGDSKVQFKPGIGVDGRIGIGSALNLDLTVLPDFSQVEIDEQLINLTRFDLFLPEKRTFFLENADVFNRFGLPPIRPFFSRRIGLDENARPVPILGGMRLTGNVNPDTRIGVLNMQTRAKDGTGDNFFAAAVHRRLFGRTTASAYLTNRQGFEGSELSKGNYGRNSGGEFSYFSPDGAVNAWATYHHAFQPKEKNQRNAFYNTGIFYTKRRFSILLDLLRMGENYETDMGFETRIANRDVALDTTLRIGYQWIYTEGQVYFFPKNPKQSRLNLMALNFKSFTVLNLDGTFNEEGLSIGYEFNFKNTSSFSVNGEWNTYNLPVSFKFDEESNEVCPPLPKGSYSAPSSNLSWESDKRRRFGVEATVIYGGFYNGKQYGATLLFKYRAQPWGNFAVQAQYNQLDFPMPYCDVELFNITPRVEIFFHRNLNWTTFVQYNNQANNFNINSRVQWRYRPMSDVFLVFTDNYRVQTWGPRNRAFVLKAVYWW